MTSVTMMLKGYGKDIDPDQLNNWLVKHGGYVGGDEFVWSAVNTYGFSFITNAAPRSSVVDHFKKGHIVILNVRGGSHWVLMTGHSGDTLHVNDPGFPSTSYALSDVVAAGVYSHKGLLSDLISADLEWKKIE